MDFKTAMDFGKDFNPMNMPYMAMSVDDAIHGFQVLREQGNQAFKENNLEMAKFFYCTAMGAIQENLRHQKADAFNKLLNEACKCTCNLSLVYLKEKNYKEALHSAEKCCQMQPNYAKAYFRRGEVHRALVEQPLALSSTMTPHDYRIKALCDYCRSYQLTNDATTLSYCIMISVDLGSTKHMPAVSLSTDFTPVLKRILKEPDFKLRYLEFLIVKPDTSRKCAKRLLPGSGMANGKCETSWLQLGDLIKKFTLSRELVMVLVQHGTLVTEDAVELAISLSSDPQVPLMLCNVMENLKPPRKVDNHQLLLCALQHKRNNLAEFFLGKNPKLEGDDVWKLIYWKSPNFTHHFLKTIFCDKDNLSVKNSSGLVPIEYFLFEGIWETCDFMLDTYAPDTSMVDLTKWIIRHKDMITEELLVKVIKCGANVDGINKSIPEPMVSAITHQRSDLGAILLNHGADLSAVRLSASSGTTLMHLAVTLALSTGIASALDRALSCHSYTIDNPVLDSNGQTPLHYVILDNGQNAAMVLKKLSKYPLDVDVRDKKTGKTVVELCQTKGRKHLMPLLVEAVQTWNEFRDAVQLGLDKPETVRESCNQLRLKGNQAYRCHDLYTAKTFYLQALNQLKKLLQITKVNPDWVNAEYARISANLSLLELTQGHLPEALAASMESIRMNHNWAKGYFRRAEVLRAMGSNNSGFYRPNPKRNCYREDALKDYLTSYSLESDVTTFCKCFTLAVDLSATDQIPDRTEFTSVVEKLDHLSVVELPHWEFLFIKPSKKKSLPKCGMAKGKCSTVCIRLTNFMDKYQPNLNLIKALIEHGTRPCLGCIIASIEHRKPDVAVFFCNELKRTDPKLIIDHRELLKLALQKRCLGTLVHHCVKHGARFAGDDIWIVLNWKTTEITEEILKLLLTYGGSTDVRNDDNQLPLNFLLDRGIFSASVTLLQFAVDASTVDVSSVIRKHGKNDIFTVELLSLILDKGGNVMGINSKLPSPIVCTLEKSRYDLAALLVDHGAELTKIGVEKSATTSVHAATKISLHTGRVDILKQVLDTYKLPDNGKLVDSSGQLPHHVAVADNTEHSKTILELLSNYPFDVEAKDRNAKTALDCCGKGRRYLRSAIEMASVKWKEHCAAVKASKGKKKQKKSQTQVDSSKGQENNAASANANQTTKKPEKKVLLVQENLMALAGKGNYTLLRNYAKSMVDGIVQRPDLYLHLFQEAKSGNSFTDEPLGNLRGMADRTVTTPENILITCSGDELESDDDDFDDKENFDSERFEDYTWEVECTESVWKTLAKLDRPLRKLAVSKIRRLAKGEWHYKFHMPIHNLSNLHLYELRLTKRSRIIWELAIAYSPRCTQTSQTPHVDSPGTVIYSEIIRIWSVVLNCSNMDSVVKQIEKSHVRGQASTVVKRLQQQKQPPAKNDKEVQVTSRERVPRLFRVTDIHGNVTCVSITQSDFFYPPASTKDNEYSVVTFYSFSDGFIQNLLNSEDVRRDFPFKGWPKEHDIINLDQNESILLLGRSGTGKTTCCLYRMWNQFRCYWETAGDPCIPRISLIKSQLPSGINEQQEAETMNDCDIAPADANGDSARGVDSVLPYRVSGSFSKSSVSSDRDSASLSQDTVSDDDGLQGRLAFDDDIDLWYEDESDNDELGYDENQYSPDVPDLSCCDAAAAAAAANSKITYVYDHLQQVFITKNSVLCAQFKRKFYDLAHTERYLAKHLGYEDVRYPATLQEITPFSYPLFLTSRDWLILLDASLGDGKSFFPRNPDGSLAVEILDMDYNYDDYTETLVMLDESASEDEDEAAEYTKQYSRHISRDKSNWRKVDANFFIDSMWPTISKEDRKSRKADKVRLNPILIWMEIKSFIKGSSHALQTTTGYLSLEEYCKLGRKMAPNFANRRKIAYQLFLRYEQMKKRNGYFDECDVVFNLFRRLSRLDDINWCIHQFYIDEVQDFTQAELTLLLHCCRWPNGLFLTGDTAQSIMRGVSFRFSDLRSVFHYISKHVDRSRGQKTKVKVPHLHDLTQNFRSHSGILQLAASVIDLLMNFFRSSLDKLPSDQGMFPGPKPVLLLSCSYSDLALLLRGNRREASAIEFGARQAIIVQSEDAKKNLPDELKAGIVLTVFESKGLEFDDVLLYNFFADSKIDKEWRVVTTYTKQYLAEHPDLHNQNHDGIEEPRPLEFDERQHKMLNSELKFLYTALTRAKCNLWIYDSNRTKRAPMFHYFQKRDLVKVVSVPSSGKDAEDSSAVESMIAAVSSSEDWKKQGDYFKKRCLWDLAILCYSKAGLPELTREVKAYSCVLMGKKYKHEVKKMKEYFVTASLNFFECLKLQPSAKWIENAAVCLFNAREYDLAAPLFERLGQEDYAIKAYQKCGNLTEMANMQKKFGNIEGAIQTLMMDTKGTLFPAALKLAVEYSRDKSCVPLKKECSINEVAHLTATYYLKMGKKELAVECVELFTEVKDKINFLKRAGFIDEAVNMLHKAKQYDNLYRLLKGQGMFLKGASISSKLHDYENYCVFLLLAIKVKLYEAIVGADDNVAKSYSIQSRLDDATELHKAGKQLKDGEIKLQVDLMCAILRENVHACYNISKCFTYLNPFGSAEALNAAISIHSQKEMPSLSTSQISSILTCLRVMLDTSEALRDPDAINQQVALQCLKFYDFEKSDETLFLPPQQFYWIPELAKDAMVQKDSDGMIQLRVADVYKTVQRHVVSLACGCLQLNLDEYLFEQINAEKYVMLNVALTKPDKDFAVACSSARDLSPYLHHCAQLIEVGYYHSEFDSFQPSKDTKFTSASHMIHFGTNRLVNAFSPQWNFYLPLTKKDIKMVQFSKVVCHQVNKSIDSIIEKKKYDPARDINSFLYKWHFLKITSFDIAELEKPLNEEAVTVNEKVKQSSKTNFYFPPPVFIKENVNISSAKYFHSFLIWSTTCKALTLNGRFMYFAEGVVKRLLLLIAKNRYIQAKISALNAVSMLEIISVGLLGVLQASGAHVGYADILVIVPQLYEHALQFFDDLNAGERSKNMWLLAAVVHTVTKTPAKKLEKLYLDALRLLQRVVCILVGLEVPSFNILTYAQGRSVYNNGFERCFVLCLCLLGNLAPLIPDRDVQAIHSSICSLAINMQHLQSTLQDRPHLLNAIKRMAMASDIKDVFCIISDLQQKYSSGMACLRYTYDIKPFVFNKIDSRYFPQFTLQPLQFLVQQFSASPQKPTIAPIGSPLNHDNMSTSGHQSKQGVHPMQTGFPTINNPSLPMRSKAPGGQSASVGVGGLNIDLGTSIDPNSDNVSLVFSEESLSPHQSPYEPPVSSVDTRTQQHPVRQSPYAGTGYRSALDAAISEGLQHPKQYGDLQSSAVEYVTPQQHFEMLNSLIAAGMTPEQLQYQIAWAQQNYYQSEAPLSDLATGNGGVGNNQYMNMPQMCGQHDALSQQLQFMQPTGGDANSSLEEEFEQTDYYSGMPVVGEFQQLTSPSAAINPSTFGSFDSTLKDKWYCRVCGVNLWSGTGPDDGESSELEAYRNHCGTSQHIETLEHYRRYQDMLKWSYNDVMEEAKKIINGKKKAPQVITLMTKIDNIGEVRSRLGREHSNTESTCSWAVGLKRVEQIANELLKLVDEYHNQLKTIPKQSSYTRQGPELFVSDDEDYLDVDVPDVKSKKDKRHKQF